MKIYLRLLDYARPYVLYMIAAVVCMVILSGTTSGIAFLVKPAIDNLFVKNTSAITVQDIADWNRLLLVVKTKQETTAAALLSAGLGPDDLKKTARAARADELSDTLKNAFVTAFDKMIQDTNLFVRNASRITLEENSPAKRKLDNLAARGILYTDDVNRWNIKTDISSAEKEEITWFNIALLGHLYPRIVTKSPDKDFSMLYIIPLLIIIAYVIKGLSDFGQSFFMGYVGNNVVTDLMNKVYRHIQSLSLSFFTSTSTGVLMSRISNDIGVLQRAVSQSVKHCVSNAFMIVGLSGVAFYQNWKLAAICFFVLPWVIIPVANLGRKSKKYSKRTQEQMGTISTFLDETISGNQTVKAFCMEEYENKRFFNETKRLLRVHIKNVKIGALSSPIMEIFGGIITAAIIYYGGSSVIKGSMTTGAFFSFVTAVFMLYKPIKSLGRENIRVQRGLAAAIRVFEVLDTVPEIKDKPDAVSLTQVQQGVEFKNVTFHYEDKPVLRHMSFAARAGEVVAIVGHSGAGKTTIANLLLRFYDPAEGGIFIDGLDIRDVTVKSLRDRIAFVAQEMILFNDTVRNNIGYGSPEMTQEQIVHAAQAAYAHEFISAMPEGYDTVIGEKGVRLSGGQRQRIAIARALVKDAPILILDEATSALDSHSEKQVQKALENLMQGRTTFLIAHRLSTVRNAHHIIVLAEGEIIEKGSHGDLVNHRGVYNRLLAIQTGYQKKTSVDSHIS